MIGEISPYHSKSPYSDFPAFAAVCIEGAILGYCKSGGSKEIALEEYSSWRSRLGRQQSSSLKSPDAVQDDPMRWNTRTDGAACFLRVSVRFPLGEHLLVAGIEHPFRGDRILVDSKDCGVLQIFLQIRWVEVSKIDAEDEGCRPKRPQAELSLALDRSQPVVAAISYFNGVIVVESAWTSVRLPLRHVVEAFGNVGPARQRIAAAMLFAAIAFDVGREFPLIGILHQCRGDRGCKVPLRDVQDHGPPALPYRIRPRLSVSGVAVLHAVNLDVIDSPRREHIYPRIRILLRSGLAVVNADHALAVVVVLLYGRFRNLRSRVRCALNGRVPADRLLRNTRRDINSELHPQAMDVVSDHLDAIAIPLGREPR